MQYISDLFQKNEVHKFENAEFSLKSYKSDYEDPNTMEFQLHKLSSSNTQDSREDFEERSKINFCGQEQVLHNKKIYTSLENFKLAKGHIKRIKQKRYYFLCLLSLEFWKEEKEKQVK